MRGELAGKLTVTPSDKAANNANEENGKKKPQEDGGACHGKRHQQILERSGESRYVDQGYSTLGARPPTSLSRLRTLSASLSGTWM